MEILTIGTGLLTGVVAPFLIQLFKRTSWTGRKAKAYSFATCFVLALGWVLFNGSLPGVEGSLFSLEWWSWLGGAIAVIYGVATGLYRWLETTVFKKIPTLAQLVKGESR